MPILPQSSSTTNRTTLGELVDQSTVLLMGVIGSLILILALLILFVGGGLLLWRVQVR